MEDLEFRLEPILNGWILTASDKDNWGKETKLHLETLDNLGTALQNVAAEHKKGAKNDNTN